ncbi:uncharacterized protein LOC102719212 [Oryza brachyantha]|nr:uncharacterized protein LOC102719212 [Oryza brachyantha]
MERRVHGSSLLGAQRDDGLRYYRVLPDDLGGLGAALPRCDLERRVHGGSLLGALSPCFHASSSSSHHPPPHSSEEEASVAAREQEQTLRGFIEDIERSIVFGICKNHESKEFFRGHGRRRRLDDYFAAAKNLTQILEHPALAFGDLHGHATSLLATAMGSLATELCHLKIWKSDALAGCLGCACTAASIWELARSSCRGGASSSASASAASSMTMSTSRSSAGGSSSGANCLSLDGYYMAISEERTVRSGQISSVTADYIDLKSVSILNKIASFMIEAGHEQMLRAAFDRHSEHLVRYIEILDIDNILGNHMEESTELVLKVWTSTMRIVFRALSEMQRQLNQNDFEIFSSLKEDYFSAIGKVSVMKLLNYAKVLCIKVSPSNDPSCKDTNAAVKHDISKMVNVLTMFQSLDDVKLEILDLFSGQTKDLILAEIERLTNELSANFLEHLVELNGLLRSQQLAISNTGVHSIARHIMDLIRLLLQQKNTVHVMLNGDPDKFGHMVTHLITSLEFLLDTTSRSLALQGQQQLFLLNNMNFILEQASRCTDLKLILGESWCSQQHGQLVQLMAGYLEASWTPAMSPSPFGGARNPVILLSPQMFSKFTSHFEMTYNVQKTWKVSDPLVRQKLREAITQKVIPLYRMCLESYSEKKQQKSARLDVEHLKAQLLEIFEG